MPEELYTLKNLAYELGVGESTVRFWRDRFNEFIPSVGQGKRRKYRREALEALRFVQKRSNRGESQEEVKAALRREFPVNVDSQEKSQRSAVAATQQRRSDEETASESQNQVSVREFVREVFEGVQGIIQEQNRRMEAVEQENRELRERLVQLEDREHARNAAPQLQIARQSREAIISYIKELRAEGKGYTAIASKLNSEGISGLRGGKWHAKTIYKILKKEGQ